MSELFDRFSLSSAQWSTEVAVCAGLLWVAMLACAISSIRAQPFSVARRRFWMIVVICLPIFGLLAYLPFSLSGENCSFSRAASRRIPSPKG